MRDGVGFYACMLLPEAYSDGQGACDEKEDEKEEEKGGPVTLRKKKNQKKKKHNPSVGRALSIAQLLAYL